MYQRNIAIDFSSFMNSEELSFRDYIKLALVCVLFLHSNTTPVLFELRNGSFFEINNKIIADFFFQGKIQKKKAYRSNLEIDLNRHIIAYFSREKLSEENPMVENKNKLLIVIDPVNEVHDREKYLIIYTIYDELTEYEYLDIFDIIAGFDEIEKLSDAVVKYMKESDYRVYILNSVYQEENIQVLREHLHAGNERKAVVLFEGSETDLLYQSLIDVIDCNTTLFRGIDLYSLNSLIKNASEFVLIGENPCLERFWRRR